MILLSALAIIGTLAGLVLFSRWLADTICKAIDRSVRTDFWSDHPVWKGNGA